MKKYWHLIAVLVMLLSLLSGCGGAHDSDDGQTNDDAISADSEEVTALVCSNGSTSLRFSRDENGAWYWFDDPSLPLDDTMIVTALDAMNSMEGRTISEDALGDYGLADPEKYVSVTVGEETTTYYVGKKLKSGNIYCHAQSDVHTVYHAPAAMTDLMERSVYDLARLPRFPELTAENICLVEITGGEKDVSLTVRDGKWFAGNKDVSEQVSSLADALSSLSFVRCVDYAPSKGVASICGFTDPRAVLHVTYRNSGGQEMALTVTIGYLYREDRFALFNDDTTVYQLSSALADPILSLAKNGIS